ncbi:MAG: hypothetical protein MUE97_06855 [Phycisphaerales bacterium]|jgi:hypothetical protein|nr:hypothetical protein [Phycisphaerales bacterium]
MFLAMFLVGLIVAAPLAWAGLVRGRLQVSKTTVWEGRRARLAGAFALAFILCLLGLVVWLQLQTTRR